MEVYIDNLVVKSKMMDGLFFGLIETSNNLRWNKIMLNPSSESKQVKFLASYFCTGESTSIKQNQHHRQIKSPMTVRGIHKLIGFMVSLSYFISRLKTGGFCSSNSSRTTMAYDRMRKLRRHSFCSSSALPTIRFWSLQNLEKNSCYHSLRISCRQWCL